ncbi:MAG: hypothetical protein AAEI08_02700 [Gammaproteobacteria bacterium]
MMSTARKMLAGSSHVALLVLMSLFGGWVVAQEARPLGVKLEGLWTWDQEGPFAETLLDLVVEGLLTKEAEEYRRRWAIQEQDESALCQPQSPVAFAGSAGDFEIFVREDIVYVLVLDSNVLALEQVRRVYMDGRERPDDFWPNKSGWSEGHWEGNTLVVRTNDFTEGTIDSGDRPLPFGGSDSEMIERYTLSEDANHLSLRAEARDPKYYVAPIEIGFDFVRSDRTVSTVDCVPSIY